MRRPRGAGQAAGPARFRPALFRAAACLALGLALAVAGLLALPGGAAAQEVEVRPSWSLVPSGLSDGDKFRLIFVTSTTRRLSSTDIADYNAFVQGRAAAGHTDIQAYSSQFRVVGSTAAVDARDNTGTTGTGVPIYWLNGDKVADDYADFYDDTWDSLSPKNESGQTGGSPIATGSNQNGTAEASRQLGAARVRFGSMSSTGGGPIQSDTTGANTDGQTSARFYGLSPVFTVRTPKITDVSVTSRPADGTNTFKADERIEVTVTFDEAVEVTNPGSTGANVRIRINTGPNGGTGVARLANFLRMDHPRKLVFRLTVSSVYEDTDGLCIGSGCASDTIALRNGATIVAAEDDVAAVTDYDAVQTTWRVDGGTQGLTGGVCDRHPAVRDAIVAAIPAASTCAAVTSTQLRTVVQELDLSGEGIDALRKEDFQDLVSLWRLDLSDNALDHLPADLFEHLSSVMLRLYLDGNPLGALPAGVFDGLTGLRELDLGDTGLSDLPAGLFADLDRLETLRLVENDFRELPSAALADVAGTLQSLLLRDNDIASIPAGAFDRMTKLTELDLQDNALASLPDNLLQPLTSVERVVLQGNPGFDGFAPVLGTIAAQSVERGARVELAAVPGASPWGDNVTWSWAQTDSSGTTVTLNDADTATPWFDAPSSPSDDLEFAFEATLRGRGTGSAGASASEAKETAAVTVPGQPRITDVSVTSRPRDGTVTFKREPIEVTVTFSEPVEAKNGGGNNMWVGIHFGGSTSLIMGFHRQDHPRKLVFRHSVQLNTVDNNGLCIGVACEADTIRLSGGASIRAVSDNTNARRGYDAVQTTWNVNGNQTALSGGVCTRHPVVRDALVAAVSAASTCADVTGAHRAAITSLNLSDKGIDSLRKADFNGLDALTGLDLSDNALDHLPGDLFEHVGSLTDLHLGGNALASLPAGVFEPLTNLAPEGLQLYGNPGFDSFAPRISVTAPAQTVRPGVPVDLEATVEPNPWGSNLLWSWTRTDTGDAEVTLEDEDTRTAQFTAPDVAADTGLAFEVTATGRGTQSRTSPRRTTESATVTVEPDTSPATVTIEARHDRIGGGFEDLVFTLTRDGATQNPRYATVTLVQAEDWLIDEDLVQTIIFAAGETTATLTIPASRFSFDPEASGNLTATVSGAGITGGADTVEVVSTPGAPITVGFDKSEYSFAEDAPAEGTVIELVATLDPAYPRVPADGAAFNVSTESGTATFRVDFVTVNLAVTFSSADFKPSADGPTARRNIGFALIGDDVYEGSENLVVKIEKSAGTPGGLSRFVKPDGTAGGRYDVTIDDAEDAPALALTADPMSIAEEDDTATTETDERVSTLTVAITNGKTYPDERTVTLTFAGDATKGTHYSVSPADTDTGTEDHQAVLGAGASSVSVTVTAAGNTTADENRSIVVSAALGDAEIGSATVTIVDDETTVDNNAADGKPVIEGVPQAGRTLTADVSRIIDADGLPDAFDYRWVRISSGTETPVGSSAAYTVTSADAGGTLRVEVSFTDDANNPEGPLASDPVPAVAALGSCPAHTEWSAVLTMGYSITETPLSVFHEFGFRADATFGDLDPPAISYGSSTNYPVTNITRSLITSGDGNTVLTDNLSFTVSGGDLPDGTVLNFGGTTLTVGTATATTEDRQELWNLHDLGLTPTWVGGQQMRLCANLPPKLESVTVGGTSLVLTYHEDLDTGSVPAPGDYMVTVGGSPGPAVTGVAISGREVTLTLAAAVGAGQAVTLEYTPGSNPVRDVSGVEAPSFMGGPVENKRNATGQPEIGGTAQVGGMLTADVSNIMDADGLPAAFDYRWVRISGGTETDIGTNASRYSPTFADVGSTIRVYVSFTDNGGNPEGPLASDAVGPVAAPPAGTCPATSDWRATLTLGYGSVEGLAVTESFGFGTGSTPGGDLEPATIHYGSTVFTVEYILRARSTLDNGNRLLSDSLTFDVSEGELPDGTVLNLGGMALTVDADSDSIDGQERWDLLALGLNPTWMAGQELAVCADLPPGLESATVEGTSLVLTYDQDLDTGSAPRPGAYLVTVDGMGRAVSGVEVSGAEVTLTLAAAVAYGQTVTVTYIPGSKPVRDGSRLNALGFAGQGVVVMDTMPPVPASGQVGSSGNEITLTFSEDLDIDQLGPFPPTDAFTVKADGVEVPVQSILGQDVDQLFLRLPTGAIRENRTVTVSYAVPATNPIQDAAGNRTVAFKDFTVDNNSTVDGTPPVPASGEVSSSGNELVLAFNEDLDIGLTKPLPPAGAFTVKADGAEVTVNSVELAIGLDEFTLSLPANAIGQNQIVTVSYAVPATNPLQDAGGNKTVAFTDFPVTNNSTVANTTPPVLKSGQVGSSGNSVSLTFNEELDIGPGKLPPASAFTVKADGAEVAVQSVARFISEVLLLNLPDDAIGQNQIVTVSYEKPATHPLQDADGNETLAFTDFRVTNNSNVANTTPPVPASGEVGASGDKLTLTFNEDLDNGAGKLPPASAFTVKAGGAGVRVRSVGAGTGADSVVLSLSSAIIQGRTVTVSYTVPTTGVRIEDADGNEALGFTDFPVTNNSAVTVDETAPQPASAMVPAEGDQLLLTFDEDLDLEQADPVPPPGAFTVTVDGASVTVDGVTAVGNDTLVLGLPTGVKVGEGQAVLVGYTVPATGRIRDAAENETGDFSGFFVANNSTVDLTPPVPESGAVANSGSSLTLTFSEDLDIGELGPFPPADAFTVKVDGAEVAVESVVIGTDNDNLTLVLPTNAIRDNRTVTVSYAVPATNPIQDAADNKTVAFTDFPVTNNSTVDGTPPVPASAVVANSGSSLTLTFSEDLDITDIGPFPPTSAFTVKADGVEVPVQSVVIGTDKDNFTLTLPTGAIGENQIVTVSYAVPATNPLRDAAENKTVAFTDFAVTNNSTVANTTPPFPASGAVANTGTALFLMFNEDLDITDIGPFPPTSAFTVKADGVEVPVQSVVIGTDKDNFTLTLPTGAIGRNQIVTVSYAVSTTNPLQDADGNKTDAFTDFPVTNNSNVANTTPPVPASAMVPASGDRLTLVFNENLDIAADRLPAADAFTVKANDGRVTVQSVAPGAGTDSLVLHLGDGAIGQGLTVTVGYDRGEAGTNPIQDTGGSAAGTFTDFPVANYSTVEKPNTAPVFADDTMREFEFPENEPKGTDVGTPVTATDADGDKLTYSLVDTRYGGMFTIDEETGQLRNNRTSPFDFEGTQQNPFGVRVAAKDGRGGTAHVDVLLRITDEKEPPLAPEAPAVTRERDDATALRVTWKAPDNRGRPEINGYGLQFRKPGDTDWETYGDKPEFGSDPLDESATSAKIIGLDQDTEYEVQVRAENADGDGAWSLSGKRRTPNPDAGVAGDLQLVVDSAGDVDAVADADGHIMGRLEIMLRGEYGTICDDRFNSKSFRIKTDGVSKWYRNVAPDLSCKLLGHEGGTFVTRRAAGMTGVISSNPIHLDEVRCAENHFQDNTPVVEGEPVPLHHRCWHAGVGNQNCTNREDVHLKCRVTGTTPRALTAEFDPVPTTHDGSAFRLGITFSEDVAASGQEMHNAFDIVGGSISGLIRNVSEVGQDVHDEQERNDWTLLVEPEARGTNVEIKLEAKACDERHAICTGDGRQLSATVMATIVSSQNQLGPQAALTAMFRNAPATHDGTTPFTFRVEFSDDIVNTAEDIRDDGFDVSGGQVTLVVKVDDRDDLWEVTIAPEGEANVYVGLKTGLACGEPGALCTSDGRTLGITPLFSVAPGAQGQFQQQDEALPLTAVFVDMPAEHDGESWFEFELKFSEAFKLGYRTLRDRAFTVTNGRVTRANRIDNRHHEANGLEANQRWRIRVRPDSAAQDVSIELPATADCNASGAICTEDGRKFTSFLGATVKGPPGISVLDATVEEGPGAVLAFEVRLGRASGNEVAVDYATADVSAKAGEDYTETSGTLAFAPGETAKTVNVPVLDDLHDEGNETLKLILSNASGAYIADAEAVGTIENTDMMPQAWLARFGRTVAEQVLDAVEARIRSAPPAGVRVTVAGQAIGAAQAPGAAALEEAEAKARLEGFSAWLRGEACGDGSGAGPGAVPGANGDCPARRESRAVAPRDLLTGSSFALTRQADGIGGGVVSLWGRGALTRFDGREGELTLDGEVTGALLGADWTRERWTAGLMMSHARGEGGYRGAAPGSGSAAGRGEVSATVTGLYPYGRYMLSDRVTVWGAAGYGAGTLVLTPEDGEALETDLELMMAAVGLRGVVVEAPPEGGPELSLKTDALGVRTASAAIRGSAATGGNLAAAEADVTRLRLGLEGTWRGFAIGTGTLEPRLEVGVRHDGGDAETGFGLDLGGGLAWSDPGTGIEAEVSGRGLLTHEAGGFRERGIAGSFGWDPAPGSDRGPSLTLTQTMGVSARGGADALLGRTTLAGLAANDDGDELQRRRLEVKLGYGFAAFGDRFTSRPEAGFGMSDTGRDYGLAWRLVRDRRRGDIGSLEFALEARRRDNDNDNAEPEHSLGFRLTARW